MMAHERQLRESLAERAMEDREAGESARESRAASAMMVVREDSRLPSEGLYLLVPTYTVDVHVVEWEADKLSIGMRANKLQAAIFRDGWPHHEFNVTVHVYTSVHNVKPCIRV